MLGSQALPHGLILGILSCAGAIQSPALPRHASTPFVVQGGGASAARSAPNVLPVNTPSARAIQSSAEGTRSAPDLQPADTGGAPAAESSAEGSDDNTVYTDAGNAVAVAAERFPDFTAAISSSRTFEQLLSSIQHLSQSVAQSSPLLPGQTQIQSLPSAGAAQDNPLGSLTLNTNLHFPMSMLDLVDPMMKGFFKAYLSPYVEDCIRAHGNIRELVSSVFLAEDPVEAVKLSQHVESPKGKYTKACVPVVAAAKSEVTALKNFNPIKHYNDHLPDAVREMNEYFTNVAFGNKEQAGMHLGAFMHLGIFGTLHPST